MTRSSITSYRWLGSLHVSQKSELQWTVPDGSKLWFVILMRMKTQWLWWCVRTGHGNKNIQGFSPLSPPLAPPLVWSIVINLKKRLGYVCNPRSLKEGTETSRRKTDVLGVRLERPLHFECKLNEPMHIGMRLLHPAAADHSVSISRQQVQCIFRFSLRSWPGEQPLSGGTGAVATGRHVGGPTIWDPYQKATDTAPSSVPWKPPVPLFFGAG